MPAGPDRELANRLEDPFLRRSLKTALHLRRYLPFYVFGTIWVVLLALFPSIRDDRGGGDDLGDSSNSGTEVATGADSDATVPTGDGSVAGTGTVAASSGGATPSGARTNIGGTAAGAAAKAPAASESVKVAQSQTGKTRLGIDCADGVRQLPESKYAMQCTGVFSGDNGGSTYHGVSGDKIRIVRREFPESANSRAADEIAKQAGAADEEVADAIRDTFIKHFQGAFELYGRQVEWIDYESENGNSTDESLGQGREGACADATYIKSELKAFAVYSASAVFGECAHDREMFVFNTGAYYPETWYRKLHPFAWGGVTECERISYQVSEYMGKRLANKPAKYAGTSDGLPMNTRTRKFGTYVPDNDEYQFCVNITKRELKEKYNVTDQPQYNYQLDLSRFPDQAAQAAVQFKTAGVTTIVMACDPFSVIFLSQAASRQNWYPEWYSIGVALNDVDNVARLFDQTQVNGRLFGMSQLGSTEKLLGPTSEPGVLYQKLTGKEIAFGTNGEYFGVLGAYNFLQSAGPILTPTNIAAGVRRIIPGGAPDFPVGWTSYQDGPDGTPGGGDHTAIDDSRETYWVIDMTRPQTGDNPCDDSSANRSANEYYNSPADRCNGTYKETYGGKRFRNGEWAVEDPPVYPPGA